MTMGGHGALTVEICDTPEQSAQGLQHRESLSPDTVLLFPRIAPYTYFHMRNVRFPIDIAAMDGDFRILEIERLQPGTGRFDPCLMTTHVVEAVAGFFSDAGLRVGDRFEEVRAAATGQDRDRRP